MQPSAILPDVDGHAAGHQGSRVKSFSASADGSIAVIVLFDSTVAVWCLATMERRCVLQKWGDRDAVRVHSGGVNAAYLTPDGRQAVTVSKDHTARIWDVATANCTAILEGGDACLSSGALSSDCRIPVLVEVGEGITILEGRCGLHWSAWVWCSHSMLQDCGLYWKECT